MNRFFKYIAILIFSVFFFSCSSIYYVGETSEPIKVYSIVDTTTTVNYTIPVGSRVLTQKKSKKYYYIIYESHRGYVYNPNYKNYHKYNSSIDGILYGYSSTKPKSTNSYNSSSGGSVNVKGYYRKNGTYVRPYTRSSLGSGRRR
jgi:hypothetical protein